MSVPAWYWPLVSGEYVSAKAVALAKFGPLASGPPQIAVPDWSLPIAYPLLPGAFFAGITLGSGIPGISSIVSDGSTGFWAVSYNGSGFHQPYGGVLSTYSLTSGHVYIGGVYISGSGFALSSDGIVWTSGNTQLGSWPASAIALTASGGTLGALLPASGLVGLMTTGGVTGSIALPGTIATGSCLAMASGDVLAVGGYALVPSLSGAAAAMLDPQNADIMLGVGSGYALLWENGASGFSENWTQNQILSAGIVNLSAVSWVPNGTQALAPSVSSGVVQVLGYSASVLSLLQSVTVSGACAVAVAGTSVNALVAQSGLSQAATLAYGGGSWSAGSPVTGLTGIAALAAFGTTGAVAAVSGGIAYLGLTAGVWSLLQTLNVGFTPTAITVDRFNNVYAAGGGALAVASGQTYIGSGAWTGGNATAVAVQQGRVLIAVPSDGLLRIYGQSSANAWTQQGSQTLSLGASVGLALSQTVLFTMGSGSTVTNSFSGAPFTLTNIVSGNVAIYSGSTWTTVRLGNGNTPSAITLDVSGNIWCTTIQNTIFNIAASGTIISSGIVPVMSGQTQTTPLGNSSVLVTGGHVYVGTSMAGVLVEVS